MLDAYILVFAGLLLRMGALGDRFGRKLTLNAGLLVFVPGSAASAFAGSAEVLIASGGHGDRRGADHAPTATRSATATKRGAVIHARK